MQARTTSKRDLIEQLDAAYQQFESLVEDLEEHTFDTKWIDNRWGVRELAAHLTGWHGKLASALERMARGERPVPEGEDWSDPEPFNRTFAAHAKGKLRDEVLAELAAGVASFQTAAERLPDDRFGEGRTANKLFDGAGIRHFREHTEMIRAWRERERL